MSDALYLLDAVKIKNQLARSDLDVVVFDTIDSTNDYLKLHKKHDAIRVCLAEQQTRGRGRLNRVWYSPFAQNIYLSLGYPMAKEARELAGLSLVVGLAVLKTLKSYDDKAALAVKWPNDVVCAREKIAGTLIEIQAAAQGASVAVIGVGVNANMLDAENQIAQRWTSLRKIVGHDVDRNELCARLVNHLLSYVGEFMQTGFASFVEEWMRADCLMQQPILLTHGRDSVAGVVIGVDAQGYLLLRLADGAVRAFAVGEASAVYA